MIIQMLQHHKTKTNTSNNTHAYDDKPALHESRPEEWCVEVRWNKTIQCIPMMSPHQSYQRVPSPELSAYDNDSAHNGSWSSIRSYEEMHRHMDVWGWFGRTQTGEAPALADISPYEFRISPYI
jgi:hypothetical protein